MTVMASFIIGYLMVSDPPHLDCQDADARARDQTAAREDCLLMRLSDAICRCCNTGHPHEQLQA